MREAVGKRRPGAADTTVDVVWAVLAASDGRPRQITRRERRLAKRRGFARQPRVVATATGARTRRRRVLHWRNGSGQLELLLVLRNSRLRPPPSTPAIGWMGVAATVVPAVAPATPSPGSRRSVLRD